MEKENVIDEKGNVIDEGQLTIEREKLARQMEFQATQQKKVKELEEKAEQTEQHASELEEKAKELEDQASEIDETHVMYNRRLSGIYTLWANARPQQEEIYRNMVRSYEGITTRWEQSTKRYRDQAESLRQKAQEIRESLYKKLQKSIERPKEQYANYLLDQKNLSVLNKEAIKESVLQRFEICNDTLWEHLKKHLREKEGLSVLPNSPNGIFRKAFETNTIDKETMNKLMDYNSVRVNISHDYSLSKVNEVLDKTEGFISSAEKVYQILVK